MWDQPDQKVSETKMNSLDGANQKLKGSDAGEVGLPLIIEESSNGEEGLKKLSTTHVMMTYLWF